MVPVKRFMWNKMVFALRLVLFERISGTNPFTSVIPYRSNVLNGTERFSMTFCSAKTFYAGQNMFSLAFGAVQTF